MLLSQAENQQLRQRFSPDGSPLRCQQLRLLEMLVCFDEICRRRSIRYWIGSGTLLGAVRHGGFIPWDDDIDLELMRDDYLRLLHILPEELQGTPYTLQTADTDAGYFFPYAKLRDTRSRLDETNGYDRIFEQRGLYIDLFVMEKVPTGLHDLSCMTLGHIYKIMKNPEYNTQQLIRKTKALYRLNDRCIYPVLRAVARLFPQEVIHYGLGIPYRSTRRMADLFPLSHLTFEGHSFPAPHNSDGYLRQVFGDYQQLPPLETIHMHSAHVEILSDQ